jgi:asparagine synthetase B (glutamine-hydrolysing)
VYEVLCLNNFIILCSIERKYVSDVKEALASTSFKVVEISFPAVKIVVGLQNEACSYSREDMLALCHGVFLDETFDFLLHKMDIVGFEDFIKSYRHQGVLALINVKKELIIVIGDPLSTRTTFYLADEKSLIVSTDMELLKSVAKALHIQLDRDIIALYEFATFGFIVSRRTIFRNIKRLSCGEYITVKPTSERFIEFEVKKYWEPSVGTIDDRNACLLIKKLVEQLNSFCKEAGESRIVVPISGGIDSTLLRRER